MFKALLRVFGFEKQHPSPIIYSKNGLTIRVVDNDVSIEVDNKEIIGEDKSKRDILGIRIEHHFDPLTLTVINTRVSNTIRHKDSYGLCECMTIYSKFSPKTRDC